MQPGAKWLQKNDFQIISSFKVSVNVSTWQQVKAQRNCHTRIGYKFIFYDQMRQKYSRVDQIRFVEGNLKKITPSSFLKAVFHKFYLIQS